MNVATRTSGLALAAAAATLFLTAPMAFAAAEKSAQGAGRADYGHQNGFRLGRTKLPASPELVAVYLLWTPHRGHQLISGLLRESNPRLATTNGVR